MKKKMLESLEAVTHTHTHVSAKPKIKNWRNREEKQKGITLIALVVTIVILLILAGITINLVLSNDGILKTTQQAKIEYIHVSVKEAIELQYVDYQIILKTASESQTKVGSTKIVRIADKIANEDIKTMNFIEYLQYKQYADTEGILNIEKLLGKKQELGSGSGLENVYKIEGSYVVNYYESAEVKKEIWSANPKVAMRKISFQIDDTTYYAEEGMTWYQWSDSEYSGGRFICDGVPIDPYRGLCIVELPSNGEIIWVNAEDKIKNGFKYYWHQIAECVFPDTDILIDNEGKTIKVQDIKEGDSILYYNFKTQKEEEGIVSKVYIHKDATDFVKYTFEDETYLESTDYHPIYTNTGWKSLTNKNEYPTPEIADEVMTPADWKKITKIEQWQGKEDCYDFEIITKDGEKVNNYFANGVLVQGAY